MSYVKNGRGTLKLRAAQKPSEAHRLIYPALDHIERHPATGSMRYTVSNVKPPLRFWTLNHFPYAVFYFAHSDHIDIVRVLHQSADIPQHLQH